MQKLGEAAENVVIDAAEPLVAEYLRPHFSRAMSAAMNLPKDVADMKNKLDEIGAIIHNEDKKAAAEEGNSRGGTKAKVKQLMETWFRMEDLVDEYTINEERKLRDDPRCLALPCKAVDFVQTLTSRFNFAYMNEGVQSEADALKDKNESEVRGNQDPTLQNLRMAPWYNTDVDVVGFDDHKETLKTWLIEGPKRRTVISVVGMGGVGKTTLAYKVLEKLEDKKPFDCRLLFTVSQSFTQEGMLKDMLKELMMEPSQIDKLKNPKLLIDAVRKRLLNKRYVVVFDDVWNCNFWKQMEFALIDNQNGSRILITTRDHRVAEFCKKSSPVQVHELKPLDDAKSFDLFCKKAFGSDLHHDGQCPDDLKVISTEIVKKCEGLPLAIVAIGGLLSHTPRAEWQTFNENLSSELGRNQELIPVKKILGFSYHHLRYNLKQCFLYFGKYPEDYEVECERLIRQWIAEGFVEYDATRTPEEVAEQYLNELIHRSLVQVSSLTSGGKSKGCHVHDLVRDMILKKFKDLGFCHFAGERDNLSGVEMVRRITIPSGSNNWMESDKSSNIRSLHVFTDEKLSESFVSSIPMKYRLLKVLDFEKASLFNYVPENLGDLFLLRYLSFRNTKLTNLPSSIGMLHNLETLDLRKTMVRNMPREINKLKKLRHLLAYDTSKGVGYGIQMENSIGDLESLQTLREVETNHGGEEVLKEFERLTDVRVLGLTNVQPGFENVLCSLINKMQHMEKLYIAAIDERKAIDLDFIVSELVLQNSRLQKVRLVGTLNKFPNWVAKLQNLVMLSLSHSKLTDDPLGLLKDLPKLLCLSILYRAYEGSCLHFQNGGFPKLEQIILRRLYKLDSISIDNGALPSLKKFKLVSISKLKEVPSGVCSLPKLEVFHAINMSDDFKENFHSKKGQCGQWIIEEVPFVSIVDRYWHEEKSNF